MINHSQLFNVFIQCINHTQQQPSNSIILIIILLSYLSSAWDIALIRVILSIGVTSQLTNSKSFNNCIVPEWLRLYIFFLPLMGSWLPAGQQVIQLQIPFLSLLLWTTPDSKCCSSGSQGNRLKTLWLTCKRFIVVYFWEHLWGSKEGRKFELAHICNSECHQLHRDLKS